MIKKYRVSLDNSIEMAVVKLIMMNLLEESVVQWTNSDKKLLKLLSKN